MTIFNVINLAGGIALFLYGMSIMGTGLEKLAGGKMEAVLQRLTSSVWKAVLLGAVLTGLIQSSAGTTVICIGLVNSGIFTLSQAIGVIMGANIGTTVTGQLIRLSDISGSGWVLTMPSTFSPIVAFVGAVLFVFMKSPKKRNIGQICMGFGILFTGLFTMENAVAPLKDSPLFVQLFTQDKDFLRKTGYPIIRDAGRFFLDVLIENAEGKLIFSPSTSPENVFIYNGKRCSVAETTTMTMAIVRETLENLAACCQILDTDPDLA